MSLNYYINHIFRVFTLRQIVFPQSILNGLKISIFMTFALAFFLINFTRNAANNSATHGTEYR